MIVKIILCFFNPTLAHNVGFASIGLIGKHFDSDACIDNNDLPNGLLSSENAVDPYDPSKICGTMESPCFVYLKEMPASYCDNCVLQVTITFRTNPLDGRSNHTFFARPVARITGTISKRYVAVDIPINRNVDVNSSADKIITVDISMVIDQRLFTVFCSNVCYCKDENNCPDVFASGLLPQLYCSGEGNCLNFPDYVLPGKSFASCTQSGLGGDIVGTDCPTGLHYLSSVAFQVEWTTTSSCAQYAKLHIFPAGQQSTICPMLIPISQRHADGYCGESIEDSCEVRHKNAHRGYCGDCMITTGYLPGCAPDGPTCSHAKVTLYQKLFDVEVNDNSLSDYGINIHAFERKLSTICGALCYKGDRNADNYQYYCNTRGHRCDHGYTRVERMEGGNNHGFFNVSNVVSLISIKGEACSPCPLHGYYS